MHCSLGRGGEMPGGKTGWSSVAFLQVLKGGWLPLASEFWLVQTFVGHVPALFARNAAHEQVPTGWLLSVLAVQQIPC